MKRVWFAVQWGLFLRNVLENKNLKDYGRRGQKWLL